MPHKMYNKREKYRQREIIRLKKLINTDKCPSGIKMTIVV